MTNSTIKNIGFISTRIAGTDGVSLEIGKWTEVLERNEFKCYYFAGKLDRDASRSYKIEEAYFQHPEILEIEQSVFGVTKRPPQISRRIQQLKEKLKAALYDFMEKFEIDLIIPENALTIPMNIPLGLAITEFIIETGIPTIAHHHDFYWERDRFLINACQDYLDKAFPPDLPPVRHAVINSIASKQLSHRIGISNTIIPNVYNFAQKPPVLRKDPSQLKKQIGLAEDDLFILQPTRIVPRKWIERSIEIVRYLNLANPILVISYASGDERNDYSQRIKEYARNMGVRIVAIDHLIKSDNSDSSEKYAIGDIYQCADLVTYPSGYEGFGNAFLESVYFKKPIIVNRYSIYVTDIEPKGFNVISIEGFVTEKAIAKVRRLLNDKGYLKTMVNKNFELAKRFFSYEILEKKLFYILSTFQ